jgi:hypothetical protein
MDEHVLGFLYGDLRNNTTKEFLIAFYVKYNLFELSYRFHLRLNNCDTRIPWKGYLIGS